MPAAAADAPTGNHQVLAIGYSTRPIIIKTKTCFLGICRMKTRRDNEPIIAIYDSNYPDTTKYIQTNHNVETDDQAGRSPVRGSSGSRVRGYFSTPYSFKRPSVGAVPASADAGRATT